MAGDKLREQKIACQIVIIADGLEKTPTHRHEELFIDGSGPLADVPSHIIYTVPMPLAYHPRFSTLTQVFANEPIPVPMLHVDSEVGMECFREIIQRRCEHCNLGTGDVFDSDDTRDFLCRQTGGHIRTLMMLVQSTLVQVQALPIQLKDVEASLRHYRFGLARRIPGAYWPWLRMFRPGALAAFPDELPEEYRRDMLHQLFVYEYTNGVPSFDVNPVIRDLPNFLQGEPAVPIPAAS